MARAELAADRPWRGGVAEVRRRQCKAAVESYSQERFVEAFGKRMPT